jgi:hypothetical protein
MFASSLSVMRGEVSEGKIERDNHEKRWGKQRGKD